MAREVEYRNGTTVQHSTFTGGFAEITVDTTKHTAVIHDDATIGGFPLAREDMVNASAFVGATSAAAGIKGVVPAPQAGDQNKLLAGDGTWQARPDEITINVKPNASTTLVLSDRNTYLRFTYTGGAKTLIIPSNASVAFPIGTTISGISVSANTLTLAGDSGVTINTPETLSLRAKAFVSFVLTKVDTNVWDLAGDLA